MSGRKRGNRRNRRSVMGVVAVLSIGALALWLTPTAWGSKAKPNKTGPSMVCDAGTLAGVYAVHGTGAVRHGPIALAGHLVFDGEEKLSGEFTEVSDQWVQHGSVTGTYSVTSDCRGEGDFTAKHEGFVDRHTFDFYGAAGGQRFSWVLTGTSFEDPPLGDVVEALVVVLSGSGERL